MKKRILGILITLVMVVGLMPATAFAAETGSCGSDVTYTLDGGTLTISGTGEIRAEAFQKRSDITTVVIKEGITAIGSAAFFMCSSLTNVDIPESVATIGDNAFSYCTSLKSVKIPARVTTISEFAFADCSSLTTVEMAEGVTTIGDYAFCNCIALKSIKIPESVTTIGDFAFSGCSSLITVEILASIKDIGECAFYICDSLTTVKYFGTTPPSTALFVFGIIDGMTVYVPEEYEGTTFADKEVTRFKPVEEVTLDKSAEILKIGETVTLTENVFPVDATNKTVTWTSSDETVAKVENGVVTAVANGTAMITVTTEDGNFEATCTVTVTAPSSDDEEQPSEDGDATPSQPSSKKTKRYDVTVDKDDVENGSVKVSSSRAKKGSTVTITVTPDDGYELDELIVLDDDGDEIELTDKGDGKYSFTMPRGDVEIEASFDEIQKDVPAIDADEEETLVLTIDSTIYQQNGEYLVNDVAPVIKDGRTMLPIRLVAEFLGADVTWNEAEQSVTITKDDTTIIIYIGQAFALVNGEPVALDAPAFIANDRTYLPVRFVAENLGAEVIWNEADRTVTIRSAE